VKAVEPSRRAVNEAAERMLGRYELRRTENYTRALGEIL
jgi:hypothetical protein